MGRRLGQKLTSQHRENISRAMKKKHKEWKAEGKKFEREQKVPTIHAPLPDIAGVSGSLFEEKELKRNFVVYDMAGERARIVFDYKTRTIGIEIGKIFSLSQGNQELKMMHNLENQLKEKYPYEQRERVLKKYRRLEQKEKQRLKKEALEK
jgi:hypothetical protein